jgi:hypothetical protein
MKRQASSFLSSFPWCAMKATILASTLLLTACSTPYQPNNFFGGYTDYMIQPNEALVAFQGNGFTSARDVLLMLGRRCAEVTVKHGYRYFVLARATDLSTGWSYTTPGYANTYGTGSAYGFGNYATGSYHATTVITPPETISGVKPVVSAVIIMSNNPESLKPLGMIDPLS